LLEPAPAGEPIRYTVVIPAYNESAHVRTAIRSVQGQRLAHGDSFEIIVVDNNSQDDTALVAASVLGPSGRVVAAREEQGPNFARQRGFQESTGSIIAFLDADCTVPPTWLASIGRAILKGACAVSGPVYYTFSSRWAAALNRPYASLLVPMVPWVARCLTRKPAAVVVGGNFGVARWALEAIGGLPPVRFWGDDARTAMLLARQAGKVRYARDVYAYTSPRRFEEDGLLMLNVRYAVSYFSAAFQ
jgi:dolichyl-phosphate beta-glucosyltransferase